MSDNVQLRFFVALRHLGRAFLCGDAAHVDGPAQREAYPLEHDSTWRNGKITIAPS